MRFADAGSCKAALAEESGHLAISTPGRGSSFSLTHPRFPEFSIIGKKYLIILAVVAALLLYLATSLPFGTWFKYRELVSNLTRVNLVIKYRGSVLGFFWSLLNPIMMLVIFSIAFKYIMRINLENYALFLIVGLIPWNFFSTIAIGSTTSVIGNAGLLKKVSFPREVFPISTTLFGFIQFLLALIAIGPFMFFLKEEFSWVNLLYLVVVFPLFFFTLGVSFALSALTVLYRDIKHFTEVGVLALFWVTPIVYYFDLIPEEHRWLFLLNPCTLFMNCFHDLIYWNRMPDGLTWIGILLWPLLSVVAGGMIFRRIDHRFAEVL
jgi:ABC-2 type transport system permease protein